MRDSEHQSCKRNTTAEAGAGAILSNRDRMAGLTTERIFSDDLSFLDSSVIGGRMANGNTPDSPIEAAAGAAGPRAIQAFSLVGDETRLSILLALWEEYEPFEPEENAVSFSELRERVGMRDSGQFNYHLGKLIGQFVRQTNDGYELRRAGLQLVQAVIAGAGIEEPPLEPTEINMECSICNAPTALTYQDEWLFIVCTECEGVYAEHPDRPHGILNGVAFAPAGFTNRSPEEMWTAGYTTAFQNIESAIRGVCDTCSGPIESTLDICGEHAHDGICDVCGRQFAVMAHFRCPVCKNHHTGPPRTIVTQHPAVVAFYYERGIPIQYEVDDFESVRLRDNLIQNHDQELVSEDPIRVQIRIQYGGDELELMLDDELDVVEVTEH